MPRVRKASIVLLFGAAFMLSGLPVALAANSTPDAPSNLGPTNFVDGSAGTDTQPQLTFTITDPDVGDNLRYQIQIDDTSDFSSPVVDYSFPGGPQGSRTFQVGQSGGSGASYAAGNSGQTLADGSYYWRVRASDPSFATSTYSTANGGAVAFIIGVAVSSGSSRSVVSGPLPWCSGPMAPGWNSSLPNGGCSTVKRALSFVQVQAILSLLAAFGAEKSLIAQVSAALGQ